MMDTQENKDCKIDRINHLLKLSQHYRDQVEAMAIEFVSLHDEAPGSNEADELMHCIYDGANYQDCMRKIMNWKLQRYQAETKYEEGDFD